jgi:hypothetical protein
MLEKERTFLNPQSKEFRRRRRSGGGGGGRGGGGGEGEADGGGRRAREAVSHSVTHSVSKQRNLGCLMPFKWPRQTKPADVSWFQKKVRDSGSIQGLFRVYSGSIQGLFRVYSGSIQGLFRVYSLTPSSPFVATE